MVFTIYKFLKSPKIFRNVRINIRRNYTNRNILKLHERGVFHDIFPDNSNNEIKDLLNTGPQTIYAGFDPTADSLHVGNLLVLISLIHCQRAGHRVIALVGGATAQVGDPSGRSTDRPELENSLVKNNAKLIEKNIKQIFQNHEQYLWSGQGHTDKLFPVIVVNNDEWYRQMSAIDFVSGVTRSFRMGTMLLRTSVKERLASPSGMNCAEFLYQIFQSADWLYLLKKFNCRFQIGGNDQMGNIVSGHNYISKEIDEKVYGLTVPLLTTESGEKLGKSAGNSVWLDAVKTSPFSLYQYWIRQKDSDVGRLLRLFTFLDESKLDHFDAEIKNNSSRREAQKVLAEQITLLVHGEQGLRSAERVTNALYGQNDSLSVLGTLKTEELCQIYEGARIVDILPEAGLTVLDLALKANCFSTQHDAMRIIAAGGFYINNQRTQNMNEVLVPGLHILPNHATIIRVGKKNYHIIKWNM